MTPIIAQNPSFVQLNSVHNRFENHWGWPWFINKAKKFYGGVKFVSALRLVETVH